jgi:hypothetical protein
MMKHPFSNTLVAPLALVTCFLSCLASCGDRDVTRTMPAAAPQAPAANAEEPGAGEPNDGEPGPSASPLYVLSTNVFSPEGIIGYVSLVPSLDASVTVDLDAALEFPGGANSVGIPGEPYIYVGLWSSPTIERWDLQPDGSFVKGPVISFANLGVLDVSSVAFSPIQRATKSYFTDYVGSKLVSWSPAGMSILGTVPLPLSNEGALEPRLMSYLTLREDSVLVNAFMEGDGTLSSDRSRLIAVDIATDQVIGVDEWVGCEKVQLAGQTSDGTAYYTADTGRVMNRAVYGAGHGASPCGLRVVPSGVTFDQGFDVNLSSLVGGRPVVGDLIVVSDDMAFLRVWHDEDAEEPVTPENIEVASTARAYRWWTWDLESPSATLIPNQTPMGSFVDRFTVEGRSFIGDNGGRGNAPFIELLPSGELKPALTAKGQVGGAIFRIR